jgi:hypothetical protein
MSANTSTRAGQRDRMRHLVPAVGRGDDLVARPDAQRAQRQPGAQRAAGHGHRVARPSHFAKSLRNAHQRPGRQPRRPARPAPVAPSSSLTSGSDSSSSRGWLGATVLMGSAIGNEQAGGLRQVVGDGPAVAIAGAQVQLAARAAAAGVHPRMSVCVDDHHAQRRIRVRAAWRLHARCLRRRPAPARGPGWGVHGTGRSVAREATCFDGDGQAGVGRHFGQRQHPAVASVMVPPHRSASSCATMGSSRSFLGT